MSRSEKPKPKLRYRLLGDFISAPGYAFPRKQYATVSLSDPASAAFYKPWLASGICSRFEDAKACYICIGVQTK